MPVFSQVVVADRLSAEAARLRRRRQRFRFDSLDGAPSVTAGNPDKAADSANRQTRGAEQD